MHDAILMQVADGMQHLLDHVTGVHLGVHTSVQDAVKELAAGHAGETTTTVSINISTATRATCVRRSSNFYSQLHDQVEMCLTFIEIFHPHHILMLDSVQGHNKYGKRL